jgi:hypothetical protein
MSTPELIGLIIAVVFGIIGVIGLVYTIYYGRKGLRKKLLVYSNTVSIPLAQAFSPEDDYKLSVLFQRRGSSEERISSVYTTFLKFANLGKEPIRGNDIAPANPIKVKIEDSRTLDIQIAGITRTVNNVILKNQILGEKDSSAEVSFDFLDFQDGAIIKILTVGDKGKVTLNGDIIGMPEGIKEISDARDELSGSSLNGWVTGIVFIVATTLTAFIYYWALGEWNHVWLLIVPVIILILAIVVAVIIPDWLFSGRNPSFPESLDLPKWCRSLPFYSRAMMREQFYHMNLEAKKDPLESQDNLPELKSDKLLRH